MPRIAIGDCQLYYERHGAGFPVLFLSGLGGYGAFWRDQVPVFAKRFEVIVHDHRGIGQSDHSRISYTVDRMAADVIELMDALGLERAVLAGASMGAHTALRFALRNPTRVAALGLITPSFDPERPPLDWKSAQWLPVYLIGMGIISWQGQYGSGAPPIARLTSC